MKVALFDYLVSPRNPPGACDLRVLEALRGEHEVTVFTSELALGPDPARPVHHVEIPTVRRPALASFLVYLTRAWWTERRQRRGGERFDVVQATDCSLPGADICYAHFCHRGFVREVWPAVRGRLGPRTLHAWASHTVRAWVEARLVRRARVIVVPSAGLGRELERVYPTAAGKVRVIPNTVDLDRFARPADFDPLSLREHLGCAPGDTAVVFVALGHFERKGLPELLHALVEGGELGSLRVWVVGGEPGLVTAYRAVATRLGVARQVTFAGRVEDVREYMWSADAFISPSHYEAFSLGLLEAAAAGLPLISTSISGSEELLVEGVNGLAIEATPASVADGLRRFLDLDRDRRTAMARASRQSVEALGPERFAAAWRELYAELPPQGT